jgi:hypothetical protein
VSPVDELGRPWLETVTNGWVRLDSLEIRSHVALWDSIGGEPISHVRAPPHHVLVLGDLILGCPYSTQIYSPDGQADTLSMFLIAQYAFMFVASAALAAIGLAFVS